MRLVRRHLVAVVVVVLALATGIALGAGPLGRATLVPSRVVTERPAPAPDDELAEALAEEVAPGLTRDRLTGRTVTVVTLPGTDADAVADLTARVKEAGGTVAARWQVGRSLVATGETALVDTLGEQLIEQLGDGVADPEAPAYQRMGQLLGVAVATRGPRPVVPSETQTTVRQSIDAAELLTSDTEDARLAPTVLLVLGHDVEDAVVEGLTTGLAERARGVVVAAPEREGDLAAVGEPGAVTTVDGVDSATGRLATVLALARAATGESGGSFGASGSDGVLPLG